MASPSSPEITQMHAARNNGGTLALEQLIPRQTRVGDRRSCAGLNLEEMAEALIVSLSTVKHDWNVDEAWLYREISKGESIDA